MLVGITTGGKLGLGAVALAFIAFAIASSFYFPRRNPDFPGDRVRGFIWVSILLFVALIAAVVVFAKETEEEAHGGEATPTQAETGGGTGEKEPEPPPETGGAAEGDAAAGETVFSSSDCGACHTLEAAGSSGGVGPNLDEAKPDFALVVDRVTNGMGAMPAFGEELSEQQIEDVAAFVVESTGG